MMHSGRLTLFVELTRREIWTKYRATNFGLLWAVFGPLLTLWIFSFFFQALLATRWSQPVYSSVPFALVLFAGIVPHALVAECMSRAGGLVVENPNYIKKVVFPVELFFLAVAAALCVQLLIGLGLLLAGTLAFGPSLNWTIVWLPLVMLPSLLFALALMFLFGAITPYLRDVGALIPFVSTALLFFSPAFVPLAVIPAEYQPYILANPLSITIESMRTVLFLGITPDLRAIGFSCAWTGAALVAALLFFRQVKSGFADVV
jgi:lipopolysaccharide transport system permease protein